MKCGSCSRGHRYCCSAMKSLQSPPPAVLGGRRPCTPADARLANPRVVAAPQMAFGEPEFPVRVWCVVAEAAEGAGLCSLVAAPRLQTGRARAPSPALAPFAARQKSSRSAGSTSTCGARTLEDAP